MEQAFDYYRMQRIRVSVPENNIPALGLFRKLGFIDEENPGYSRWMYRVRSPLTEVDIFSDLTYEQIERVTSLGTWMTVSTGKTLGRAGDPGDQLFIIVEGQAELSASSAVGDITVRIAGPGESFPLASLIGPRKLITSATAMTDMKLLAVPSYRLLTLCSEETDIGMRIYATIADVLATRYSRTLAHLTESAERALKDADFFANV